MTKCLIFFTKRPRFDSRERAFVFISHSYRIDDNIIKATVSMYVCLLPRLAKTAVPILIKFGMKLADILNEHLVLFTRL